MTDPQNALRSARTLQELGHAAERAGLEALLDAPLDRLADVDEDDDRVRDAVRELEGQGDVGTVRELLLPEEGREVKLRKGVRPALVLAARRYFEDALAERPAPVAPSRAAALPPRPRTIEALQLWARQQGVEELLLQPAENWAAQLPAAFGSLLRQGLGARVTMAELIVPPRDPRNPAERFGRIGPEGEAVSVAAFRALISESDVRLDHKLAEEKLEASVSSLKRDPDAAPTQVALASRLLDARRVVLSVLKYRGAAQLTEERFAVEGEPAGLVLHARRSRSMGATVSVQITLPLHEPKIRPECSCGNAAGPEGSAACPDALSALTSALQLLTDPDRSEEARRVAAELATPAWQRQLRAIEAILARTTLASREPDVRLSWRLTREDGVLQLHPFREKRRGAGFTKGTKIGLPELARDPVLLANEVDRRAFEALAPELAGGGSASRVEPGAAAIVRALTVLADHPRLVLGDEETPIRLQKAQLGFTIVRRGDGVALLPWAEGRVLPLGDLVQEVRRHAPGPSVAFLDEERGTLWVLEAPHHVAQVLELLLRGEQSYTPDAVPELIALLPRLQAFVPIEVPAEFKGERVEPQATMVLRLESISGEGLRLDVRARPLSSITLKPGEGQTEIVGERAGRGVHAVRDLAAERANAEALCALLPLQAARADGHFGFRLDDRNDALDLLASLQRSPPPGDVVVELPDTLRLARSATGRDLKLQLSKRRDWFGLDGTIEVDDERVKLAMALDAARRGDRWVRLKTGLYAQLEQSLLDGLKGLDAAAFEGKQKAGLELSGAGLHAAHELARLGMELVDTSDEVRARLARIDAARDFVPPPPEVNVELRSYQRDGYEWLSRLAAWGEGGVLADDMGLGKTVQAIALLQQRRKLGPALVIAPTSVCPGWMSELAKFAPGLRVTVYRTLRDRKDALQLTEGDVLIASYGLVARDEELLRKQHWSTLVLDEAHAVKNAATRRARAVRTLQAGMRVALTGTPIENHLGELHSLFGAAVPGLLGSLEHFRERFVQPIERDGDQGRRKALALLIKPFLLRRKKKEVANELPDRIEQEESVELTAAERRLYEDARLSALGHLKGLEGAAAPEKRRFEVLAALTRMRLIACHPRLVDPLSPVTSSKLTRLMELLEELRAEGRRALVFSQFVKHLSLVREALNARNIAYLYLDGQTPAAERGQLAERFQRKEGGDFFLISLRAGGTGLNLTAADTVIHLDPWWNPAVEDQASDRAHRIGQTNKVHVIRLVTRDTIETEVLKLHHEKRALVADLLEGTDVAGKLGTEELYKLIEQGGTAEIDEEPDDEADALVAG